MKNQITALASLFMIIAGLTAPQTSFASCEEKYQAVPADSKETVMASRLVLSTGVGLPFAAATTALVSSMANPSGLFVGSLALGMTTIVNSDFMLSDEYPNAQHCLNLIHEAQDSDGTALRDLTSAIQARAQDFESVTIDKVAQTILQADQEEAFCPGKKLAKYEVMVQIIANRALSEAGVANE